MVTPNCIYVQMSHLLHYKIPKKNNQLELTPRGHDFIFITPQNGYNSVGKDENTPIMRVY